MTDTVTICIPSIPNRSKQLCRAVASVSGQTRPVEAIAVAVDHRHEGAWATRNRAIRMANSEWVGFLDDDDELLPFHVEHLLEQAVLNGADMVWGWFEVMTSRGLDPDADPWKDDDRRGRQYDIAQPHCIPITYMVRRGLLVEAMGNVGGFLPDTIGAWENQDMPIINEIVRLGGKLFASPATTWFWHHWGYGTPGQPGNTSGLPSRW